MKRISASVLLVVCLFVGAVAFAQAGDGIARISVWDQVKSAGGIGWSIILLSITMFALVIEHLISIRLSVLMPPGLVATLQEFLEKRRYREAVQACRELPSAFSSVILAALTRLQRGQAAMEEGGRQAVDEEGVRLFQKVGYVALIGNISPMLGLLGTVVGMIRAFHVIATQPNPNPADLAGGISQALVTTYMGLVVAIPAIFFHAFFRNRVERSLGEMNLTAEDLIRGLGREVSQQ
jgi:biopolymer transport protein ExbB